MRLVCLSYAPLGFYCLAGFSWGDYQQRIGFLGGVWLWIEAICCARMKKNLMSIYFFACEYSLVGLEDGVA